MVIDKLFEEFGTLSVMYGMPSERFLGQTDEDEKKEEESESSDESSSSEEDKKVKSNTSFLFAWVVSKTTVFFDYAGWLVLFWLFVLVVVGRRIFIWRGNLCVGRMFLCFSSCSTNRVLLLAAPRIRTNRRRSRRRQRKPPLPLPLLLLLPPPQPLRPQATCWTFSRERQPIN